MNRLFVNGMWCAVVVWVGGCDQQASVVSNQMTVASIKTNTGNTVLPSASTEQPKNAADPDSNSASDATPDAGVRTSPVTSRGPVAVLESNVFDFGTMEPYQSREHTFVIRNEGDEPLEISAGHSSCKCTLGEVGEGTIAPGGESTVKLTWRSGDKKQLFAHEAEVLTNDPKNPILLCRVKGKILSTLLVDPGEFSMPSISPGSPAESSVFMTSEVWQDFRIFDLKSSMEELKWEVVPLDESEKERLHVRSGYRIRVHVPDELPRGYFSHWLKLQVQPEGESARLFELPINGRVLRRVSLYGSGIDSTGLVKLGKVRHGKGMKKYFTVKVRDQEPSIAVKEVVADPEYLQVSFLQNEKVNKPGLYRMLLEIPPSAPVGNHMGDHGKLQVIFQNPRFEDIDLNVEFAIIGQNGL